LRAYPRCVPECPLIRVTARPSTVTLFPYTTLFRSKEKYKCLPLQVMERSHLALPPAFAQLAMGKQYDLVIVVMISDDLHGLISRDRQSTRLNSSHGSTSYAVFCLKKKNSGEY